LPADLKAIHVRQADIEQDEIKVAGRGIERLLAAGNGHDIVAASPEELDEQGTDRGAVLDDEYAFVSARSLFVHDGRVAVGLGRWPPY
jgi:hypothetical protein